MRYQCTICGKLVKDKFLFGLLHVCLSDSEIEVKTKLYYQALGDASRRLRTRGIVDGK